MAVPLTRCYKEACGSGEQEFKCTLHLDVDGSEIRTYIATVTIRKDQYDALAGASQTEFQALTMGDLISAAFGHSSIDKV